METLKDAYKGYENLTIIYNESNSADFKSRTSSQHGEGLNIILEKSNSKYLLVHDPDFFWVKKDYLKIMAKEIENGALVIGAPYGVAIKTGAPDFPSSFGCAYNLLKVKKDKLNFDAGTTEEKLNEHKYPGWKMRQTYSGKKYISFKQEISNLPFLFGHHSYSSAPRFYVFNDEIVGYHLFRGSFVSDSEVHVKNAHSVDVPQSYKDTRYLYSKYFYYLISRKKFNIFEHRRFFDICKNVFNLLFRKSSDGSKSQYRLLKSFKRLTKNRKLYF